MSGPLEGINVLDFGQAGVGPWAGTLLSWLGANVIKIERPEGDVILTQPPFMKGLGVGYTVWNMSKKSAILNLKEEAGRKALEPLLREADVVSENLRPGVMGRLGIGYQNASAVNPRVVYASSPGWGLEGPLAAAPGTDADFQAFTGFGSVTGSEGGRPEMARHAYHFDLNASAFLAANIVLGLIQRDRTGSSSQVFSSHLASTLSQLSTKAAEYLTGGELPVPLGSAARGSAPNEAFQCQDLRWLAVAVESDSQWRLFCDAIRRDDLAADPRYRTNPDRVAHRAALSAELRTVFVSRPSWWWHLQLSKRGVPVGHFYDFEALRHHAQVVENEFIIEMDIPHQGKVLAGGLPWRFSKTPASMYAAPYPGQHTKEVMERGFGLFGPSAASEPRFARPNDPGNAPLAGMRVVDASQGFCGPYLSLMLADAGAEVIKVEPHDGDYARSFVPLTATGSGAAFELLNRNKQSVVLDLDEERDQAAYRGLVRTADVVIEDWGVGRATARGLGYEQLAADNPGLVYCAISPFGEKGPLKNLAGSELVVQAMTDYCNSLGEMGKQPIRWGADSANATTGGTAFLAVVAALLNRNRTGEGQRVAVSLMGTLLCLREASWSVMSDVEEWEGPFPLAYTSPPIYGWKTKDKQLYFRLHHATETEYAMLLIALGMEEVLGDERFADAGRHAVGMGKYAAEVLPIWDRYLSERSSEEIIDLALKYNALAVAFNNFEDVFAHPQIEAAQVLSDLDHPVLGKLKVLAPPFKGPWQTPTPAPAPRLGEQSNAILATSPLEGQLGR